MKTTNPVQNQSFVLACAFTCAALSGCCWAGRAPLVVIVPEAVFRTEASITNRIRLPLTTAGRKTITDFIEAGGNWKNRGGAPDTGIEDEMKAVEPVLDYLTTHTLSVDEMKTNGVSVFTAYFGKKYTSQIVDSRNYDQRNVYQEAPDGADWSQYPPWPLAMKHDRFWWVFFLNDRKQCTGLMLMSEITREKPKN
jgi:hypothetical protein